MLSAVLVPLPEAVIRLRRATNEIREVYGAKPPATARAIAPDQVVEALEQFLTIAQRLDRGERETGPMLKDDVSRLGEYGLSMLSELITCADQLDLPGLRLPLDESTLAVADWIIRHDGELRTLEPIVNALAALANRTHARPELGELERFMGRVIQSTASTMRQNRDGAAAGQPWRLLHLNRGIVATRTHNPEVMEQAFDDIVRHLPDDAPVFFAEGMEQMVALNYPPQVRAVVTRFYERFTRRAMH
jgi:hypothetical protein